jgi:hypothetical protein
MTNNRLNSFHLENTASIISTWYGRSAIELVNVLGFIASSLQLAKAARSKSLAAAPAERVGLKGSRPLDQAQPKLVESCVPELKRVSCAQILVLGRT